MRFITLWYRYFHNCGFSWHHMCAITKCNPWNSFDHNPPSPLAFPILHPRPQIWHPLLAKKMYYLVRMLISHLSVFPKYNLHNALHNACDQQSRYNPRPEKLTWHRTYVSPICVCIRQPMMQFWPQSTISSRFSNPPSPTSDLTSVARQNACDQQSTYNPRPQNWLDIAPKCLPYM